MSNDEKRGWWRKYFHDHPGLKSKHPHAYASQSANKAKVWCMVCYERRIVEEVQADAELVANGSRTHVRERNMIIENSMYTKSIY